MITLTRRSVLFSLLAAPIVVRAGLIMPVKVPPLDEGESVIFLAKKPWDAYETFYGYDTLNVTANDVLAAAEYDWNWGARQVMVTMRNHWSAS